METTLEESITAIFGAEILSVEPDTEVPSPAEPGEPATVDISGMIEEAQQHYNKAQQYLKTGDWTGYGKEMDALKAVLDRLYELTLNTEGLWH